MAAGWPGLGSALPLLRNPLEFLRAQYAELGPVFRVRAPRRRFTVLAGLEANRFVATEGRDALLAGPFWSALTDYQGCPHNMVALDGANHRTLRQLYVDDLSRQVVEQHRESVVALTLDTLAPAEPGRPMSVRALCRLLVSRQVHHLLTHGEPPVAADTVYALTEVFRYQSNVLLLGKWPRPALKLPAFRRHVRHADGFLSGLMRRTEQKQPPGWFSSVRRGQRQHPELFTEGDVRASFLLPFVAGVDTVGSTLAFLLRELLCDGSLYERVRAEVDHSYRAHAGAPPSVEALRELADLRGMVLETLRLYPAAFAIYRRAAHDFEFEGFRVEQGCDVLLFTSATHTDGRYFAEPRRFDLERFRAPRNEHRRKFALAPYGGGPHICLGAGMGEALLLLSVATLLRHLELECPKGRTAYGAIFDPSLSLDDRFQMRVRVRRVVD